MVELIAIIIVGVLLTLYGTLILKGQHEIKKQQKFLERRIKEI